MCSFDTLEFMLAPNTMSMSMSALKLTVFHIILQIQKIKMTTNIVFVSKVGSSSYF
jgi:hypothetical protein